MVLQIRLIIIDVIFTIIISSKLADCRKHSQKEIELMKKVETNILLKLNQFEEPFQKLKMEANKKPEKIWHFYALVLY